MKKNPFAEIYDIVVVGGGLSGTGCTLACAGNKKVLLIEKRPNLGWEVTSAFCSFFHGNLSKTGNILKKELESRSGIKNNTVCPSIFEISLASALEKLNVDVMLYTYPVDVIKHDEFIGGLIVGNKTALGVIKGMIFVDATENSFIVRKALNKSPLSRNNYSSVYYIFFNGVEKEVKEPEIINKTVDNVKIVSLHPGFRNKEVFIEIQAENESLSSTRIKLPRIITYLRNTFDFLAEALVSHISYEPLYVRKENPETEHLRIKNLYPVISTGGSVKFDPNYTVNLLEAGIETGRLIREKKNQFMTNFKEINCIKYPDFDMQVEFDVIVAGGGTSGTVAGIASGREGVKTAIIEHSTCLGGIGTGGGIFRYYLGYGGGIQKEIEEECNNVTSILKGRFNIKGWHPEAKKIVLERMAAQAKVKIFYQTCCTDVEMQGNRITGIFGITPAVSIRYLAKVFIDATGDGDIAVKAGAQYTDGRETDGLSQPFTLVPVKLLPDELTYINFDSGLVDSTDVIDLTRARMSALRLFKKRIRNDIDIPLYICPITGIRQSRQIVGKYVLTLMDQISGTKFPDAVCIMYSNYDNHLKDMENQSFCSLLWRWFTDNYRTGFECEIPYRCLLPQKVVGLVVAGRAISLEPEAHYALRMQKDLESIGEVAGIAAGISVKNNTTPDDISIEKLQSTLKKNCCWNSDHQIKPAINKHSDDEGLKQKFITKNFKEPVSVWSFYFSEQTEFFLTSILKRSPDPQLKFWSAALLAIHGNKKGLDTLLEWLKKERKINSNLYISIVVIIGRLKDKKALGILHEILFNRFAEPDVLMAALRAIGEINNKTSIAVIQKFLSRENIPATRNLSEGRKGFINKVSEDILWQMELTCAEVLKKLGKPSRKIVDKYIQDDRAYVRNYARMIG